VIYLADDLACALAEAFQEQPFEVAICPNMRATWAKAHGSARLLDLTGDGTMFIGAVGALSSGRELRRRTQRWGRAIYEDYGHLSGIRYRAAHQGGLALALWETAPAMVAIPGQDRALRERGVWERVVVALAAQGRVAERVRADECRQCVEYGLT
jgi:transposase